MLAIFTFSYSRHTSTTNVKGQDESKELKFEINNKIVGEKEYKQWLIESLFISEEMASHMISELRRKYNNQFDKSEILADG